METPEIIGVILAGLTLLGVSVALSLGVISIRESRRLHVKSFEHKVLDEILDWTIFIVRCSHVGTNPDLEKFMKTTQTIRGMRLTKASMLGDFELILNEAHWRGKIISEMASVFGDTMQGAVDAVSKAISEESDLHTRYREEFMDLPDDLTKFRDLSAKYVDEEDIAASKRAGALSRLIQVVVKEKKYNLSKSQ